MERLRERRKRTIPEIPSSSMADIAFLLIIFFMLTAVFTSRQGLRFALPEETPVEEPVKPLEAIRIRIKDIGDYEVDKQPMDFAQTEAYIQGKLQANPKKPVIIHALPDSPYAAMVEVFDLLRALEVKNIAIPTKADREHWKEFGIFE